MARPLQLMLRCWFLSAGPGGIVDAADMHLMPVCSVGAVRPWVWPTALHLLK